MEGRWKRRSRKAYLTMMVMRGTQELQWRRGGEDAYWEVTAFWVGRRDGLNNGQFRSDLVFRVW